MTLKDRFNEDLKTALKSGDGNRVQVLRFLLAQLHNREIEKHGTGKDSELTDEETIQVLQKEAKKRREALDLFRKGGRDDLVKKEGRELEVVHGYLPKPLTREEIGKIVEELVSTGLRDFNALMKETMKQVAGRSDGRTVGELIREKIQ